MRKTVQDLLDFINEIDNEEIYHEIEMGGCSYPPAWSKDCFSELRYILLLHKASLDLTDELFKTLGHTVVNVEKE